MSAAIGDGRRAALAIAALLLEGEAPAADERPQIGFEQLNCEYFEPALREEPAKLSPESRDDEREIVAGLQPAQAEREACRCFSCGSCLACDNCWTLCPDSAVIKIVDEAQRPDASPFVFDYDHCKGCGLCAQECPTGFIRMIKDA